MVDLLFSATAASPVPQPHSLPVEGVIDPSRGVTLWREGASGWESVPCQVDASGPTARVCWVAGGTAAPVRYRLASGVGAAAEGAGGFTLEDCRYRFKVRWNGAVAAAYNFIGQRDAAASSGPLATIVDPRVNLAWVGFKPFWYPVYSPSGLRLTENSPADHPHHHSIWFGHASVNGVDCWIETGAVGRVVLQEIRDLSAGPVFAGWSETNWWLAPDGTKLLEEDRRQRLWRAGDDGHLLDVRLTFRATEGPVRFGREKDAGLGIRVADSLDVEDGGTIVNSRGERNEAGTFDRPAEWVDYSGPIADGTAGVAIFNGPEVPPHPWFTRDYGPLLSNPWRFGEGRLEAGGESSLSFRLYLHDGDAEGARVDAHYRAFADPPMVEAEPPSRREQR